MKRRETPAKKQRLVTISVAIFITLILLFHMFTFQVRFTEQAVVTTFGKPSRTVKEAGLYWKLPYPFQNVYKFDARLQVFNGKLEQVFTADDKNIIISTYIGWRVDDARTFLTCVGTLDSARKNLEGLVRSYTNGVLAQHPFSHLVSDSKDNKHWGEIEYQVLTLLNEGEISKEGRQVATVSQGVKNNLGLVVEVFGIERLELPEKTTQEVFNRMREERNRIAEDYRSRGDAKAQEIRAQADAEKRALLIKAMAEAREIHGKGDAAAAQHYKVFEQNRELAIWLRKLDALEKLLAKKTTLLLDTKTSPFDLLHQEPVKKEAVTAPVDKTTSPSDNKESGQEQNKKPDDGKKPEEQNKKPDDGKKSEEQNKKPDDGKKPEEQNKKPDDENKPTNEQSNKSADTVPSIHDEDKKDSGK
jgi:membrane protease subunit HflC